MTKQQKQKILVVDDHEAVLYATISVLKSHYPEAEIFQAQTIKSAIEQAKSIKFDLLIVDLAMPENIGATAQTENGVQLLKTLMWQYPTLNIVVQTASPRALVRLKAAISNHEGGFTVADKSLPMSEMLTKVDWAFKGVNYTPQEMRSGLELKPEWLEVLQLAFKESLQDIAIAKQMNIAERTLRHYWTKIYDVLRVYPGEGKNRRFHANSGGYVHADDAGSQILINFRSRYQPFRTVSLTDIQNGNVNPDWIRGKIVLIGMTNPSAKDYRTLSAIKSKNSGMIYGVEVQAHEISQLISAVLYQRSLIKVWTDFWEYLWIIIWGIFGLSLCFWIRNPLMIFIYVGIASICLFVICYGLINIGWWIPIVPAFLSLIFNSIGLAAFYRYEEALRYRIQDRQLVIEQTFDAIHSYPLQTLNLILREVQSQENLSPQEFILNLQKLNQELRDVYDLVKRESISELNNLYLSHEQRLDLSQPLYDILFEVYLNFVECNSAYFDQINPKIIKFEPMEDRNLTIEQKRSLCRFLEEALRNVEKYAHGTTRLDVICTQEDGKNVIRVADNGLKFDRMADLSSYSGFGTKLAKNLAKQLEGEFKRYPNSPKGIVCQLTWSAKKRWFWRF